MPQHFSNRLLTIFAVLFLCLFGMPWPGGGGGIVNTRNLFKDVPLAQKFNLKPGIDIAGGTSLTYQIKVPPGSRGKDSSGQTMAEAVAAALKKRVDPQGVLNLVWRPQGDDRLEIQIPRSVTAGKRDVASKAFNAAQADLKKLGITSSDVMMAVEKLSGEARDKKLADLAAGSKARQELFASLTQTHDEIEKEKAAIDAAKKAGDRAAQNQHEDAQARAEIKYEADQKKIDALNVSPEELQAVLDLPDAAQKSGLDEVKAKFQDFPALTKAIDEYAAANAQFKTYKGSLDDAADLKRLLRGSGVLEFHILVTDLNSAEATAMIERLKTKGPAPKANDTMRWYAIDNPAGWSHEHPSYAMDADPTKPYALAWATTGKQMVHERNKAEWALDGASAGHDNNGANIVEFQFDAQGAKLFSELTRNNINSPLAIVLDDRMISAPNINSEIGAKGQISGGGAGGFSAQELKYLVNTLSAGSLPATLADEPISERTVSPQLGEDNLTRGLFASAVGLVVVGVFLIGYYYLAGLVAFFAVVMNLIIILGVLVAFGATFTLPSIAAIVLTVGTAVDANVLVFERMREEEHRGFPLKLALQHAYERALSAIVDSNMTTAITSACLYAFGSEEVKGFGLTLLIGIISSLFTALFVTKTIFGILINKYGIKELGSVPTSFPKWDKLLKPNIDWMAMIWPFVAFSAVFIVIGLSAFVVKKRDMFDIEFASGTSVQFELKPDASGHGLPLEEVRNLIAKKSHDNEIPAPSVVSINGSDTVYEVVTPSNNREQVTNALMEAIGTKLLVEVPSTFDQAGAKVEDVLKTAVIPIESDSLEINGKPVPQAASYIGGAAIVLRNLTPEIAPNKILDRINSAAAAPGSQVNLGKYRLEVDRLDGDKSPDAGNHPAKEVVVLVANPSFAYAASAEGWKENVANPIWNLANEGVNKPAKLQRISSFDPQVARDTQGAAFMATAVSILIIMIYIWFRFGDMKYATATVVALVHDTIAVVGAVGMSHFLENGFGRALLIEPFRINLTLVAAILTIMGYSMIDTIVVFDRIRENRGRYGSITRKVINDSINQTLSRTLLTAGTTILTVSVMYICGGPGIHGFTFVLLVGILIGTYSSIAIAAPILLLGGKGKGSVKPVEAQTSLIGRRPPIGQAQRA